MALRPALPFLLVAILAAGVYVPGLPSLPATSGDVGEALAGLRPTGQNVPTLPARAGSLPVLGEHDVVVVI